MSEEMKNKLKLDLQMFADDPDPIVPLNPNTNTTGSEGLSDENKTYYHDTLIDNAEPYLVHDQFGTEINIPEHGGKTVEVRYFDVLAKNTTALTEGVTPDGSSLSMGVKNVTLAQYGDYVTLSDVVSVTTIDPKKQAFKEDGTPDFSEDFFGKMASLTVSGQLNGETFATAFRNIYTFGPTFRAENSNTPRHAAEFWMMEPEICFADLADVCQLEEDMLKYVIRYLLENAKEELNFFNSFIDKGLLARLQNIVDKDFIRCPYTKAVEILKASGQKFDYEPEWGIDLQTEHERYLTEVAFEGSPVFVTDYPKDIKAFYMRLNEDGKTVAAADLLVPGVGELCGGSQREERLDVLEARIRELGMKEEDYWWYLDLRRYGTVKHGGFGLGFERLIMYVTGMGNIRDVVPFPRTVNNLEF